jgi:hypothetical protein
MSFVDGSKHFNRLIKFFFYFDFRLCKWEIVLESWGHNNIYNTGGLEWQKQSIVEIAVLK